MLSITISMQVKIKWPSKERTYDIISPWRKDSVKRLARKNLKAFSSSVVKSSFTSQNVLKEVTRMIRKEMKLISSENHGSVLRDCNEGIRYFKWERVFTELCDHMPTLTTLLCSLVSGKDDAKRIIFVCMISCMLLKNRSNKIGLLPRTVSVLLYGNGCSKEVSAY